MFQCKFKKYLYKTKIEVIKNFGIVKKQVQHYDRD